MSLKTSIPKEAQSAPASSGATQPAGKHSECDSAITDAKVLNAVPEKATEAQEVKGAATKAIAQQLMSDAVPGTNSSPKARRTNYWGIGSEK